MEQQAYAGPFFLLIHARSTLDNVVLYDLLDSTTVPPAQITASLGGWLSLF